MQPNEFLLAYVYGDMSRKYEPFCPFEIPWPTIHQTIIMINIMYESVVELNELLIDSSNLHENFITQINNYIDQSAIEITNGRLSIEN